MLGHGLYKYLEDPRYSYRGVHLIVLAFLLFVWGMAAYGAYFYLRGKNQVREENLAFVSGTMDTAKEWRHKGDHGYNITLREYPNVFSPLITSKEFKGEDFLRNESPGNPVQMIVNKSEFAKSPGEIAGIAMNRVHIFQLESPKGEYLSLEVSRKDFASERKYALLTAVILPFASLGMLPKLVVKKTKLDRRTGHRRP